MYICIRCKKEMCCAKNSVGADYGDGCVYPGDVFRCPACGFEILSARGQKIEDTRYTSQELYFDMTSKNHQTIIKIAEQIKYKPSSAKISVFSKIASVLK